MNIGVVLTMSVTDFKAKTLKKASVKKPTKA
ncbi:Uncharacterised protein [Leclercia adecarboxylata]|uniref:Uncharacterized protein n=1 Tax=Leclercia adecarboxylata TaxID=83655 RepID=A0A4U9HZN3_9ENTR|nr:Uncharacterised protein [Leclercia adecarboxylata]